MSRTHNELSQVTVTARPFNTAKQPYTPTNARYRVDDCITGRQLIGWTTITTPSTAMEIVIPGSANAIISDRRNPEPKVVTVNTDNGLSTEHYEEYTYRVKDLKFAQTA
jgi:hypothetical protein